MSETPEEERPAAAPPPEPAPAPAPPPSVAPNQPTAPVYQRRGFQLAAVGVIGLLLGGAIGLGVGLTAGFAFGGHNDRPGHHQQWGPRDNYRQPDGKQMPRRPFAPPPAKQPPSQISPSPQAS